MKTICFTTSLVLIALHASGQSISGISGTFVSGETITISGSSFGSASDSTNYFEDFEGAGCDFDTTTSPGFFAPRQNGAQAYSGSISLNCRLGTPDSTVGTGERQGWAAYRLDSPISDGDYIYFAFWARWDWGYQNCEYPDDGATPTTGDYQVKAFRLSSSTLYAQEPDIPLFSWTHCDDHPPYTPNMYTGITTGYAEGNNTNYFSTSNYDDGDFPFVDETWSHVECYALQSNDSTADGEYWVRISRPGQGTQIAGESGWITHPTGAPGFQKMQLGDWISSNGRSAEFFFDDFVYQDTWARVYLCDTNDWSTATRREIQPYTSWSAGSISCEFNPGGFAVSDTAYFIVIDAGDSASAGYEIIVGGAATDLSISTATADGSTVEVGWNDTGATVYQLIVADQGDEIFHYSGADTTVEFPYTGTDAMDVWVRADSGSWVKTQIAAQ